MNSFRIKDALDLLIRNDIKYHFTGMDDVVINNAKSISQLSTSSLSFYRNNDPEPLKHLFDQTNLIILRKDIKTDLPEGNYIFTENPSLVFNIIGSLLIPLNSPIIHPTAIIAPSATIGQNSSIGAYSIIGNDVQIGNECIVMDHCVINNAKVGDNSIVHSGVKIGNAGLGSYLDENGNFHDFPHFGEVIIGNNVVVQDNAVINRGTLNDTEINDNTRIGPLTSIAHGAKIGKSCFISQSVTIAGSASIGDYVKVWGNASIRDGIAVSENSVVGMGAVVTKNIPSGETWAGNPAKPLKTNLNN